jgi:hypothetical protein
MREESPINSAGNVLLPDAYCSFKCRSIAADEIAAYMKQRSKWLEALRSPQLGAELLEDARGRLPLDVFAAYVRERTGTHGSIVQDWGFDPSESPFIPINSKKAVDVAYPLVEQADSCLKEFVSQAGEQCRGQFGDEFDLISEAIKAIDEARVCLLSATETRRGRGQPATMRHVAARAWVIRKFNPHSKKASWAKLADVLFIENGRCPRKVKDDDAARNNAKRICGLARHRYDSLCTKDLQKLVGRLQKAMKTLPETPPTEVDDEPF